MLLRNLPKTVIKLGITCQRVVGPVRVAAMTLAKCDALDMQGCFAPSVMEFTNAIRDDVRRVYPAETNRYQKLQQQWEAFP